LQINNAFHPFPEIIPFDFGDEFASPFLGEHDDNALFEEIMNINGGPRSVQTWKMRRRRRRLLSTSQLTECLLMTQNQGKQQNGAQTAGGPQFAVRAEAGVEGSQRAREATRIEVAVGPQGAQTAEEAPQRAPAAEQGQAAEPEEALAPYSQSWQLPDGQKSDTDDTGNEKFMSPNKGGDSPGKSDVLKFSCGPGTVHMQFPLLVLGPLL
jgi:hypothetical protein